jgi:hypothetical protein
MIAKILTEKEEADCEIRVIFSKVLSHKGRHEIVRVKMDNRITPLYCFNCNLQLPHFYRMDGGRYGQVGTIRCGCGADIHCVDSDNIVEYLDTATWLGQDEVGKDVIDYAKMFKVDAKVFATIQEKLNVDVFLRYGGRSVDLKVIVEEFEDFLGCKADMRSNYVYGRYERLPAIANRWLTLLDQLGVLGQYGPSSLVHTDFPKEPITSKTLLQFLESQPGENPSFLGEESPFNNFEFQGAMLLGDVVDDNLNPGMTSYKGGTHYALGFYPFNGCRVYRDKKGRILLSYIEFGGHAPFRISFPINKRTPFLFEPFCFFISFEEDLSAKVTELFRRYGLTKQKIASDLARFKGIDNIDCDLDVNTIYVVRHYLDLITKKIHYTFIAKHEIALKITREVNALMLENP